MIRYISAWLFSVDLELQGISSIMKDDVCLNNRDMIIQPTAMT